MNMKRLVIVAVVVTIVVGGLGAVLNFSGGEPSGSSICPKDQVFPSENSSIRIGESAPEFIVCTADGKLIKLSDYRGKPAFVNFWASWCPACRVEMPSMEKIHQTYRGRMYMLAVNVQDNEASARAFFSEEHNFSYTLLIDAYNNANDTYRVRGIPQTFLVSSDGIIQGIIIGARDWMSSGCVSLMDVFASGKEVTRAMIRGC